MVDSQSKVSTQEVYQRLIDRLGLALDVARTGVRLRDEQPTELELKGLSSAEYDVITAYLQAKPQNGVAIPPSSKRQTSHQVVWLHDHRPHGPARKHDWRPAK